MKSIRHALLVAAVGAVAALPIAVAAQAPAAGSAAAAKPAAGEMTEAEVRKVDKDNNKITLKHGTIKNLDMPPMTMVFEVKDRTLLDKVKAGDKVTFTAAKEGGQYVVTSLQTQP